MRELPIIFSTDMVRAILDDRKNVTRRVIKPQPANDIHKYELPNKEYMGWISSLEHKHGDTTIHIPKYQVGDHLWMKEKYYYLVYFYFYR